MELYHLDYTIHEPTEDQGWLYMAEIPALPGCRAWEENPRETLKSLADVAEAFILSYRERGEDLPPGVSLSPSNQGRMTVSL